MNSYKVCVYAICKDEERFADRWMDSMGEADMVIVTDTGSSDNTVERLRARGAIVYEARVVPWRFDAARNISLGHVPEDADICVCTDIDEVFSHGWRSKLEEAWRACTPEEGARSARVGKYLYNWSFKPDGGADVQFWCCKIHERHFFHWRWPVHEYIQYVGDAPLTTVLLEGVTLSHHPDPTKERSSYLGLLETAVEEAPDDARMRYYLGREYMYRERWRDCIDTLEGFLKMPSAFWDEERCAAMRWIARAYMRLGLPSEAYRWHWRAIAEAPRMRDPFVEFAQMCYEMGDWPMTLLMAGEALKITEKSDTFVNMGYAWDHTPDDLRAIAAYNVGLTETALTHARRALELSPEDERLKNNVEIIARLL